MLQQRWFPFVLAALVVVLDQITKVWADTALDYRQAVHVIPYLDWYLSYNPGAAFSFLAQAGGWQRWFFILLSTAISIWLILWIWRLPAQESANRWALAFILGGAIGNLIDRLVYGHVIDFIQVWLGSYPWPTFNLADSAIFLGAALLIVGGLVVKKNDANPA